MFVSVKEAALVGGPNDVTPTLGYPKGPRANAKCCTHNPFLTGKEVG
jgi:hypothetical protein